MRSLFAIFAILLVVSYVFHRGSKKQYAVGVGQAGVAAKLDLGDKLDPALLPDVLKNVLASIPLEDKPDSKEFQQQVVRRFSQAVMDDTEVGYRVDLNEDGTVDPLMVVPESVDGQAVVYSLRVADPQAYPSDPGAGADWDRISTDQSIELAQVAVSLDRSQEQVSISSTPNRYLYEENPQANYTRQYQGGGHNWIQTYFMYRLFSDVLFGPYGWGFGGFYGGYYGAYYRPVWANAPVRRGGGKYARAPKGSAPTTSGGKRLTGSRLASRKGAPPAVQSMKSRRAMAVRQQTYSSKPGPSRAARNPRYGGFGRGRAGGFGGGGSRGWGK